VNPGDLVRSDRYRSQRRHRDRRSATDRITRSRAPNGRARRRPGSDPTIGQNPPQRLTMASSAVRTLLTLAVTLADLPVGLSHPEVACSRCERRGRLGVARLIERAAWDQCGDPSDGAGDQCGLSQGGRPQHHGAVRSLSRRARPSHNRPGHPYCLRKRFPGLMAAQCHPVRPQVYSPRVAAWGRFQRWPLRSPYRGRRPIAARSVPIGQARCRRGGIQKPITCPQRKINPPSLRASFIRRLRLLHSWSTNPRKPCPG
jgi:hypothetical protein